MIGANFPQLRNVLCLGAHSDDIEIGCGGTLLQMLDDNPQLNVCWVVFGAGGERADEARQSAEAFLADTSNKRIVIKDFRDSYFPAQWTDIKVFFHQLSQQFQPDLIFTHRHDDRHQDHRVLNELTWCAFRNHVILEYEIPKYEGDLGQPNLYSPVTEEQTARKIELLDEMFATQRNKQWFSDDTFWSLMRIRGLECHSPSRFAEAFHTRKLLLQTSSRLADSNAESAIPTTRATCDETQLRSPLHTPGSAKS